MLARSPWAGDGVFRAVLLGPSSNSVALIESSEVCNSGGSSRSDGQGAESNQAN